MRSKYLILFRKLRHTFEIGVYWTTQIRRTALNMPSKCFTLFRLHSVKLCREIVSKRTRLGYKLFTIFNRHEGVNSKLSKRSNRISRKKMFTDLDVKLHISVKPYRLPASNPENSNDNSFLGNHYWGVYYSAYYHNIIIIQGKYSLSVNTSPLAYATKSYGLNGVVVENVK